MSKYKSDFCPGFKLYSSIQGALDFDLLPVTYKFEFIIQIKPYGYTQISALGAYWYRLSPGKYCYGKTPWQTWVETKGLAKEKQLENLFYSSDSHCVRTNADE